MNNSDPRKIDYDPGEKAVLNVDALSLLITKNSKVCFDKSRWANSPGGPFQSFDDRKKQYRYAQYIDDSFPSAFPEEGLIAWHFTKMMYAIEPALHSSLIRTKLEKFPAEILDRLPFPVFFLFNAIDMMPRAGIKTIGAIIALLNKGKLGISWLISCDGGPNDMRFFTIELDTNMSLDEMIACHHTRQKGVPDYELDFWDGLFQHSIRMLPCIFYLAAEKPDIRVHDRGSFIHGEKPEPKKTKKGMRFFVAESPSMMLVGEKTGAKIREAEALESEAREGEIAPHIRRAHWHLYWVGKGRKEPRLLFLPPTLVNADEIGAE